MRIPSGVTDQLIYFVAVDATDFTTRETGLSSFTVYRSRNGGTATAFTTPTVTEVSSSNMPGVYKLLLDEDMTIDSGDDSQEFCLHITHAGMAPVTRTFELYRTKITAGETLTVASGVGSANAVQLSGDGAAADNAESFFDGTGYAGTNNVIPTVTTVNGLAANVITAAATATDFGNEVADAILNRDASGSTTNSTLGAIINDWENGGRLDLIIDDILTDTGTTLQGDITSIQSDTNDIQTRIPAALVGGRIDATVDGTGMESGAINVILEAAFTYDATADYASAHAGSLVKQIADNAGGSALTETGIAETVAEYMFSHNTALTYAGAHANSVVKQTADNAGGSALTEAGIADAVWDEARSGHTTSGTFGQYVLASTNYLNATSIAGTSTRVADAFVTMFNVASPTLTAAGVNQTGDSYAITSSGTFGNSAIKTAVDTGNTHTDTEIAAIITTLGSAGAGLTAVPWNPAWDTEVQSEAEDALIAHRLDELLNADSDIDGAAPPTVGSVFHELMTKTAGSFTYDQTTDSLEAIRDRGDAAWVTGSFSTHSAADVWAVATRVLTAGTNIALAKGTGVTGFTDIDAAGIRTAVGLGSANLDTQLGDLPTNAELSTALGTADDAVIALLTTLSTDVGAIPTNAELATALAASWTTALSEPSARTDGSPGSPSQYLHELLASQQEKSISGTTMLWKKLNGSTTLATMTLDSASDPTSVTRSA